MFPHSSHIQALGKRIVANSPDFAELILLSLAAFAHPAERIGFLHDFCEFCRNHDESSFPFVVIAWIVCEGLAEVDPHPAVRASAVKQRKKIASLLEQPPNQQRLHPELN